MVYLAEQETPIRRRVALKIVKPGNAKQVIAAHTGGAVYRRREPTATPLYPIVQHHLETFLAEAADADPGAAGVPAWVEDDFRAYLRRGILAWASPAPRGARKTAFGLPIPDPTQPKQTPAISTESNGNHAVRSDRWRYIRYRDGSEELYEHAVDAAERVNLAADPAYADTLAALAGWLEPLLAAEAERSGPGR